MIVNYIRRIRGCHVYYLPVITFCHRHDSPYDAVVACATTDISFDALFDLLFRRGWVFFQERFT